MEDKPRLPLEVVQLITDDLAEEDDSTFSSLKQLSLVCQDFLSLARKHIFGTITVGKIGLRSGYSEPVSPTVSMLHSLVSQNPVLAEYIHTLVYHDYLEDRVNLSPMISSLFNQLTKLRSLTIDSSHQGPIFINFHKPIPRSDRILTSLLQLPAPTLTHLRLWNVTTFSVSDLMPCVGLKALELNYSTCVKDPPAQISIQPGRSIQPDHFSLVANLREDVSWAERLWTPRWADGSPLLDFSVLRSINLEFGVFPNNSLSDTRLFGLFNSRQLVEVRLSFFRVPCFRGISSLLRGSQRSLKRIDLTIRFDRDDPRGPKDIFPEICHELEEIGQWSIVEEFSLRVEVYARLQNNLADEWGSLDRALTRLEWQRLERVTVIVVADVFGSEYQTGGSQFRGLLTSPTVEFKFMVINPYTGIVMEN